MVRPFDGYGDYVELTEEEIEAMNYEYNGVNWRDGAVTDGVGLLGEPTFKGIFDNASIQASDAKKAARIADITYGSTSARDT